GCIWPRPMLCLPYEATQGEHARQARVTVDGARHVLPGALDGELASCAPGGHDVAPAAANARAQRAPQPQRPPEKRAASGTPRKFSDAAAAAARSSAKRPARGGALSSVCLSDAGEAQLPLGRGDRRTDSGEAVGVGAGHVVDGFGAQPVDGEAATLAEHGLDR